MKNKISVNIAKVFVDEKGKFGNPVGIILDENQKLDDSGRQKVAARLNFSETVFIDSLGKIPEISVFNPQEKVKFAGHAVLGTIYFINHNLNINNDKIECGGELVESRSDGDTLFIIAPLSIMPNWNFEKLTSVDEVENISDEEILKKEHTFVWAWINKEKGLVRVRTFAPDWGIPEDQANGSGSMLLASKLNRNLKIHHGDGSVISANPVDDKYVEVGGLVVMDQL